MGRYNVWSKDYGEDRFDGKIVEATCPQYAAQKWAEWRDALSADYTIVGGTPATVTVECLDTGRESVWIVYGESVPEYTARLRVEPPVSPVDGVHG